mgnify:CR=1 FL=1
MTLKTIGLPVMGGYDFFPVKDIIMCQAQDNCTHFHLTTKPGKIKISRTLKWTEKLLDNHYFFRVHDSFIINLLHIKKYRKGGEGGMVELTGGIEINVARRKKEVFFKVLLDLNIISSGYEEILPVRE